MALTTKPRPKPVRHRNAAPRRTAPRPTDEVPKPAETTMMRIAYTAGGILGASLAGVLATRFGFHPGAVASVITGVGSYAALKGDALPRTRSIALGAAAVGGSQLLFMNFAGAQAAPAPTSVNQNHAPPTIAVRPKNADLGTLPPGALDAAFERARAELALTHDAYTHESHDTFAA
jgi:hypothetical protein